MQVRVFKLPGPSVLKFPEKYSQGNISGKIQKTQEKLETFRKI
jgi:hypothetical protein